MLVNGNQPEVLPWEHAPAGYTELSYLPQDRGETPKDLPRARPSGLYPSAFVSFCVCFYPGGAVPIMDNTGRSARKGYLFQDEGV